MPSPVAATMSTTTYSYPPQNKTAIITGASSGIGLSSAKALYRAGWNVVLTGRREAALQTAVQEVEALEVEVKRCSPRAAYHAGDTSSESSVQDLFRFTLETFGQVDLVFCNAGITPKASLFEDSNLDDWKGVLDTNLTGTYLSCREAFKTFKAAGKGGRIIINGSISAHTPRPNSAAYTASKHALTGLTKALALDGRKYNISLSQIDIGNASSSMTSSMTTGPGVPQANGEVAQEPVMDREFVALEVRSIAELPLEVSKLFVVLQATKMPSMVGRG